MFIRMLQYFRPPLPRPCWSAASYPETAAEVAVPCTASMKNDTSLDAQGVTHGRLSTPFTITITPPSANTPAHVENDSNNLRHPILLHLHNACAERYT